MKRQYVGHVKTINKYTGNENYRVFWLKPCEKGVGYEPVVKFTRDGKMYFPTMEKLPEGLEPGKAYDVIFDESGNIVEVRK